MKNFYSNGKLLLTGEYVVLKGAKALAIPTKYGQSLSVESKQDSQFHWKSLKHDNSVWFDAELTTELLAKSLNKTEETVANRLFQILIAAKQLNPKFLSGQNGFDVITKVDFPTNWGLGSSSTLINNIANWAEIDAFDLLQLTFGGSGYDIACAKTNSPITYQYYDLDRRIETVDFNPSFSENLYFVHLNKKRNSQEAIKSFNNLSSSNLKQTISDISSLTDKIIESQSLSVFQKLIESHESLMSKLIQEVPVKKALFNDFNGSIKSLGAWGGDFILVASKDNPTPYFKSKGFETIIAYQDMVLN